MRPVDPEKSTGLGIPESHGVEETMEHASKVNKTPPHLHSYSQAHPDSFTPLDPAILNQSAFAGRLGGGQRYALSATTTGVEKETPDAYRNASWKAILSMQSITHRTIWKLAIIEGVGTCVQTIMTAYLGVGLVPSAGETSVGPIFPVAMATLGQIFIISLFIWGLGPLTGGHLNPLITLGTLGGRLCSLPRAILYVLFQCIGAIIGGWVVRGALGTGTKGVEVIPGCFADPHSITAGEAYAFETSTAFFQLFLAFSLGLDPRVQSSVGPTLSPLLIGLTSALSIFFTGFAKPGYLGAASNPARCLGLMTASKRFDYHYIHWLGDITAAVINGLLYAILPPYTLRQ